MFLLFAILTAAPAVSAPMTLATPANAWQWIGDDDYPHDALRENRKGVVGYQIVVAPTGIPQSCSIILPSFDDFNKATCAMMMARSKFVPASDDQGQPTYSLYEDRLVWTIPGSGYVPPPPEPDVEVALNKLPVGKKQIDMSVSILHNYDGDIIQCKADGVEASQILDNLACDQAKKLPIRRQLLDNSSHPVRWLERLKMRFSVSRPLN